MESDGDGVNEFLQRIRELGDKRDREDEERARKLEEEIIAGREARRARRDERARSLSPQKDSPFTAPLSLKSVMLDLSRPETADDSSATVEDTMAKLTGKFHGSTMGENETTASEEKSRVAAPLSWQRRPKSTTISSSSRPTSFLAKTEEPQVEDEPEKRRSQIALNLSSKDPSWFRQTADRGATSGALRKAQDDGMDLTARMALPGLSSPMGGFLGRLDFEKDSEPEKPLLSKRDSNETLSSASTFRGRSDSLHSTSHPPSTTSSSGPSFHTRGNSLTGNLVTRFEPNLAGRDFFSGDGFDRPPAMSPSQGRISPERRERTPSPTKGLGGFVQSAMLKREGSLNKRWSNSQQLGSLSRNSSTASNRPNPSSGLGPEPSPGLEDFPLEVKREDAGGGDQIDRGRDTSPVESASRLTSSPGAPGDIQLSPSVARSMSPPASPTKTFDQKRWSPTKSSWLESALKKSSESPPPMKPFTPPQAKPPAKVLEKKFPDPMGPTMRPPTNPKPSSLALKKPSSIPDIPLLRPSGSMDTVKPFSSTLRPSGSLDTVKPKPEVGEKPNIYPKPALSSPVGSKASVFEKPPPPPKETINFRAGLKPRQAADSSEKGQELPFLNAMSRLRSTKTQTFVPNNELKERILAGKASLQASAGPQKTKGPDPLKEMVMSAKDSLQASAGPQKTIEPDPLKEMVKSAKGSLRQSNNTTPPPLASPKELPMIRPRPSSFSTKQNSAPGRLELKEKGSSLANRFNPNLANLLQRGPPTVTTGKSQDASPGSVSGNQKDDSEPSGGKQLTHMTKERARGPKRRAPTKADGSNVTETQEAPKNALSVKEKKSLPAIKRDPSPRLPETPPKLSPKPGTPTKSSELASKFGQKLQTPTSEKTEKAKPPTPAKSPLLRATSASNFGDAALAQSTITKSPSSERALSLPESSMSSPSSRTISRISSREEFSSSPSRHTSTIASVHEQDEVEEPIPVTRTTTASWRSSEAPVISKPSSFISRRNGDGLGIEIAMGPSPTNTDSLVSPLEASRSTEDPSQLFSGFFVGPSVKPEGLDLDIVAILSSNRPTPTGNVKTLKIELSEITGFGKLQPVPQQFENVLFNESMYVCVHIFETNAGLKGKEVYFWSGDKVSEPAVEDALLFARKMARENDGKLIRLRQGRETSAFFQALGGIVITRRGSRSKMITGNPFVLCARHCMGSIVLDEVDCKASSLCSGFPFIVSAKGQVFLWKGRGSTAEEVGIARLVAFDMSGGGVQEIDEDGEPDMFFDILDGSSEDRAAADYWHLKPAHKSYSTRLFRVDLESQTKVIEVSPYCQSDLNQSEIYVVDAFFELYIVLGANSQSKRAEFQSALQFAQEYAILAASVDDRPFIPVSSVIVGGAPREFKVLFRNWEDAKIPTSWQPLRKPSLRLVGLTAAMEAMKSIE